VIAILLSALALVAALYAARMVGDERVRFVDRWEAPLRRYGPLVAGAISALVVWYVWDAITPIAKVHDESSYLLQAELFARGRWTAPSPPIPEFFEQPHVQVVPAVASKYPPGHALLLAIGALVNFPPLIPLLLTGVTGGLVFALATRVANAWVGLLTWTIWLTAPIVLRFQPGYYSEVTTGAAILAAWWALLEWREARRTRWLLLLALTVGWGAITRPLTMLALAVPIGVVVIRDAVRLRLWRDLALAVAAGVAVLAILPLWNAKTTGDWRVNAIEEYRKDYLPFDKIGFTPDTSPPRRTVTPVLKHVYDYFLSARKEQTLASVPKIAADRAVQLTIAFFQGSRLPLILFAVAGLLVRNTALRFGAWSALALFVAYLPYAHWAPWTIYYLEITPVVAALTAAGIWLALGRLATAVPRMRLGAAAVALVVATFSIPTVGHWKRDSRTRSALDRRFLAELDKLPAPAIVFVKYSPRFASHIAVVYNHPDLAEVPVWVVHDLGARNDELRRLAPNRQSFDFEEEQLAQELSRR
jgi:hypothetical protein